MNFFALNRFAERVFHNGDSRHVRSVYETDENSFYNQKGTFQNNDNGRKILNDENSILIGEIIKDVDSGKLTFKPKSK